MRDDVITRFIWRGSGLQLAIPSLRPISTQARPATEICARGGPTRERAGRCHRHLRSFSMQRGRRNKLGQEGSAQAVSWPLTRRLAVI